MGLGNVAIDIKIRGAYEGQRAVNAAKKDINSLQASSGSVGKGFQQLSVTAKESWAGIAAGVGGAAIALEKVMEVAEKTYRALEAGAKANDRLAILEKQIGNVGELLDEAREKSAGLIDERTLVSALSKFQAFGLEVDKFDELVEQATKTAIRLGTDPAQAVEDLTTGIARGSTAILDNLGILVKASDVQARYTETTGKSAEAMDGAGKVAATLGLALDKLAEKNADVEPAESQAAAIGKIATFAKNAADSLAEGALKLAAFIIAGEPVGEVRDDFDALSEAVGNTEQRLAKAASAGAAFASGLRDALAGIEAETALSERLATETARIEAEEQTAAAARLQDRFDEIRKAADKLLDPELRDEFLEQKGREALSAVQAETRLAVTARVEAVSKELQWVRIKRLGVEQQLQRELLEIQLSTLRGSAKRRAALEAQLSGERKEFEVELAKLREKLAAATSEADVERVSEARFQVLDLREIVARTEARIARMAGATGKAAKDANEAVQILEGADPLAGGFAEVTPDMVRAEDAEDEAMERREQEMHERRIARMKELADITSGAISAMKGSNDELVQQIGAGAEAIIANMEAFTKGADSAISASGRVLAAFVKDETAKAAILAITEGAAAIAALASGAYEEAALHFVAAGMYGVVAGVSSSRNRGGGGSQAPAREREVAPIGRNDRGPAGTVVYNINAPAVMGGEQAGGVQLARLQAAGANSGMGGGL